MATEYQFKLATAKDLPPAWYELVLKPETFQEHLNNLYEKPHGWHVEVKNIIINFLSS